MTWKTNWIKNRCEKEREEKCTWRCFNLSNKDSKILKIDSEEIVGILEGYKKENNSSNEKINKLNTKLGACEYKNVKLKKRKLQRWNFQYE